jgi:N6-L-threonylcarbamoyladenine synthase
MKILAIETSCDETGIALVEASGGINNPRFKVIKNLVSSQINIHRPFGGVVPNLAKREHLKNLPVLYKKMFGTAATEKKLWKEIDFITVTVGPGLEPALWTGIEFAKKLSAEHKKPLVGANHLEGHLSSFLLPKPQEKEKITTNYFPAIALIVSGGHTILLEVSSFSKCKRLGETRDDAAGEAFDKVARLLDLPYPGGPEIEKLAKKGKPNAIVFPRPMLNDKSYDFSFSGLKTAVLYYVRDHKTAKAEDIAASFQQAAIDILIAKTIRAARASDAHSIILCGGVAANKTLRASIKKAAKKVGLPCFVPETKYNLDNAAMIASAGYLAYLNKRNYPFRANGSLEV